MAAPSDIFLSYSRDDQAVARHFAEGFEQAGFSVWWDVTLNAGEDYDQVTEQALRAAKAVVVLWSVKSVTSRWVRTEATIALQSKTLVPVTIEACQRPIMFELTQTADLCHWNGDSSDPVWLTFLSDVQRFVQRGVSSAAASAVQVSESLTLTPPPPTPPARRTAPASKTAAVPSRSTSTLAWGLFAASIAIAASLAWPALQYWQQPPPPETRLELVTPATDDPVSFALSPDGSQIVFVASGEGESRLWLRHLSSTTAEPLAGTEGASTPFWSPDGKSVAFYANAMLKRLDLGSVPQNLVSVINGQSGAWNADGTILYAPGRTSPLMQIAASGGEARQVTTLDDQHQGHMSPRFLPDGQRYLFFVAGPPAIAGIYLGSLADTPPLRITAASTPGVYHPSGRLLWLRDGTLLSQPLDLDSATLTGESITLADGLAEIDNKSAFAVAAAGQIAYRAGTGSLRQLTWYDRQGTRMSTLGEPDPTYASIKLSPDGQRVALSRGGRNNNRDIWVLDATRASRLTFDSALDHYPLWSPDATRLVFRSNRTGAGDIYEMTTDSAGSEHRILAADQLLTPSDWSRDGRFVLYIHFDPVYSSDIAVVAMDENHESTLFLQTPIRETYPVFSPDGRWVAYHSDASGRPEVYVRPFTAPGGSATTDSAPAANNQWQISTDGGIYARWSNDGSELFYLNPDGALLAVPIAATATAIQPGVPQKLFGTSIFGGGVDVQNGHQYDVAPDGRFLINAIVDDADQPITLIQNWNPDAAP